jgi:hypothetical protein
MNATADNFETSILDAAFNNNDDLIIQLMCSVQSFYELGNITEDEYEYLNNLNEIKHLV